MIEINRIGNKVAVVIDTGLPVSIHKMRFEWCTDSELVSAALVQILTERLQKMAHDIRAISYERGYRDGRGRKPRCDCFLSVTELMKWECEEAAGKRK